MVFLAFINAFKETTERLIDHLCGSDVMFVLDINKMDGYRMEDGVTRPYFRSYTGKWKALRRTLVVAWCFPRKAAVRADVYSWNTYKCLQTVFQCCWTAVPWWSFLFMECCSYFLSHTICGLLRIILHSWDILLCRRRGELEARTRMGC